MFALLLAVLISVALLFYALSPALRSMDESVKRAMADSGAPRMPVPGPRP